MGFDELRIAAFLSPDLLSFLFQSGIHCTSFPANEVIQHYVSGYSMKVTAQGENKLEPLLNMRPVLLLHLVENNLILGYSVYNMNKKEFIKINK